MYGKLPPDEGPALDDQTARRIRAWRAEWRRRTRLGPDDLDELSEHLRESIEAFVAEGLDPAEAAERAIRRLGEPDDVDREFGKVGPIRPRHGLPLLDVRFALRQLRAHPVFSMVAVASIAVAIASNTLVFSVVNAFLLRDQGFGDSHRLVEVYTGDISDPSTQPVASWPMVDDLREGFADVFQGVVGYEPLLGRARIGDTFIPAFGEIVDRDFFAVLEVAPALGRTFDDEDARAGRGVTVVSWDTWQSRFQGRPDVLGTEIEVNGERLTIVGVAPERFRGAIAGIAKHLWVPRWVLPLGREVSDEATRPDADRDRSSAQIKARLRPGITAEQAERELVRRAPALAAAWPESYENVQFRVLATDDVALSPAMDRIAYSLAGGVLAVVALVLLVASMNVAGFLLARGTDRRSELDVRRALGASRGRLVGQLFIESLVLALLGGAAGLALCWLALQAFTRMELPIPIPLDFDFSIDGRVLAFTVAATLAAAVLFGLFPALRSTDRKHGLGSVGRTGARSTGTSRVRAAILVVQVAVSLVFMVTGGLFARSLWAESRIEPGFRTADAAILTVELASGGYAGERLPELLDGLRAEAAGHPELAGLVFSSRVPLGSVTSSVEVRFSVSDDEGATVQDFIVSPGWFDAMEIALLEGRVFGAADGPDAADVIVVSRSFAERFALQGARVGGTVDIDGTPALIVGIVDDVRVDQPREGPTPHLYRPLAQTGAFLLSAVGLGTGPSGDALRALRASLDVVDPEVMVWSAATMEDHLAVKLLGARIAAGLLGGSAAAAVLLTLVGVFGSVRYAASRRAPEMAIRLSLGAPPSSVVRLVVDSMVRIVALGAGAGLALSLLLAPVLQGMLYDVPPFDPWSFGVAVVVLTALAAVSAWLPARRARRTDLTSVLKEA